MKKINQSISTLFIIFLLGLTNLGFAQFGPGQVHQVSENVYSFGTGEYYSMFVVTTDGVMAFESVSSHHSQEMVKAIKEITDQPIKYMFHSHNHWDHASGGQVFIDLGAATVAHKEAYDWMAANTGQDMAVPTESWSGNYKEVVLGDTKVELHYFGMNHGLGMTVFLLPKEKIAYIADIVTPNRVMFNIVPDFNIREWERSLPEIMELDFDTAIFSHNEKENPLHGGTKQDIQDQLKFIQDVRYGIYGEFKKGTNPMAIPTLLDLPQYKDWAMYDEWFAMNVWRVLMDEWMGPFPWRPEPTEAGN